MSPMGGIVGDAEGATLVAALGAADSVDAADGAADAADAAAEVPADAVADGLVTAAVVGAALAPAGAAVLAMAAGEDVAADPLHAARLIASPATSTNDLRCAMANSPCPGSRRPDR